MTTVSITTLARPPRSLLAVGLALVGALAGACAETRYRSAAFSCEGDRSCPQGFVCRSDLCVRPEEMLPPLLALSPSPITPRVLPDVDRGGTISCWTVRDEVGTDHASVYATFNDATGVASPVVRLATVDTRRQRFLGSCAPIPNSQGSVLVALWLQRGEVGGASVEPLRGEATISETRLLVWAPSTPLGTTRGAAQSLYSETSPDRDPTPNRALELDVVGDKVWVPVIWSLGIPPQAVFRFGAELALNFLVVGAQEAREGRVVRYAMGRSRSAFLDTSARLRAGAAGTWLLAGDQNLLIGYATPAGGVFVETSADSDGFARVLVSAQVTTGMTTTDQLAVLWPDELENNAGTIYRVAWFRPLARIPSIGPRLPFRRVDTPEPASLVVGTDLYVIGASTGVPVPPMGIDGGVVSDGAAPDGVLPGPADGSATPHVGALTVYRIPWGADSAATVEVVQTIEPRVAPAQVISASAALIPGAARAAQLAWVEYYPPDGGRRGARYALYTSRIVLR